MLLLSLGVDPAQAPEGGITIIQAGAHPALIANGKITDPATGFSSTIDFPLPQLERASALHASGIPVGAPSKDSPFAGAGDFVPHVVVRNLLDTAQSVTITVEYPQPAPVGAPLAAPSSPNAAVEDTGATDLSQSPDTAHHVIPRPPMPGDKDHHPEWGAGTGATVGSMKLASLPVGSYSTADYSLAAVMSQLPLPLPFCSIRIQYSGAPGSLEAEVSSVESKSDLVVDARVENEGNGWAGSGANPWHLDKNTESILFLTNMSDQPARIGFSITAAGIHYYLAQLKLNPHETRAINIRSLRDAQLADFKKNKIPAAATDGSVSWIRLDDVPVMGRVMVIRGHEGTTSSYDCTPCTCPASLYTGQVTPLPADFTCLVGQAMQCTMTAQFVSCNGNSHYYYNETNASAWSSNNSAVATVDSSVKGEMHSIAVGSAVISASYSGYQYHFYPTPQPRCTTGARTVIANTTATVQPPSYYVKEYSFQESTQLCSDSAGHQRTMPRLLVYYQVLESDKATAVPGATVTEQLSFTSSVCATSNACVQKPTPSTWTADANGAFTDGIANCSATCVENGECTEAWQQTFMVNGKPAGIMNGSITGVENCVSADCNSGPSATTH